MVSDEGRIGMRVFQLTGRELKEAVKISAVDERQYYTVEDLNDESTYRVVVSSIDSTGLYTGIYSRLAITHVSNNPEVSNGRQGQ